MSENKQKIQMIKLQWGHAILNSYYLEVRNFRGNQFSRIFLGHFVGINFREFDFTEDFAGINFPELSLTKDFEGINFCESAPFKDYAGVNLTFAFRNVFQRP